MPNLPDNNSLIPASRVAISDQNIPTRAWYRWFFNIYTSVDAARQYGSFYDTTNHTAANINTAYPFTFNSVYVNSSGSAMSYGVYIGPITSQIYVNTTATYNFQLTAQLYNADISAHSIYVWPRINGVDVSNSAAKTTFSANLTLNRNFMINLNRGDYVEFVWSTDNINVSITSQIAAPPVPAIPSVELAVTSNVGV